MKHVYSMKKLYDPKFPIMFFTSRKKAVESAETSLLLLTEIDSPEYNRLDVGDLVTYVSTKIDGVSQDIVIQQQLVH